MNYQMDYTMSVKTTGQSFKVTKGKMAGMGDLFYDSSRTKFILQNKSWIIQAEHDTKKIRVVNIAAFIKKHKAEPPKKINSFGPMDDSLFNNISYKVYKRDAKGLRWLKLDFNVMEDSPVQDFYIAYDKYLELPVEYKGTIKYPAAYSSSKNETTGKLEEKVTSYVTIKFRCYNIQKANKELFSHSRIIKEKNKKFASLNRYKNYKINSLK